MSNRKLKLTVALDWPKTAANVSVFTEALAAEFRATKERRLDGPYLSVGFTVHSDTVIGNKALPRLWRRLVRYLQNARVISPALDPWCIGARVVELPEGEYPSVDIELREGA